MPPPMITNPPVAAQQAALASQVETQSRTTVAVAANYQAGDKPSEAKLHTEAQKLVDLAEKQKAFSAITSVPQRSCTPRVFGSNVSGSTKADLDRATARYVQASGGNSKQELAAAGAGLTKALEARVRELERKIP